MLFAWLVATGSHWDLVQTFAWGRMIANYSQSMPLAQAVKLTFTPDNLCGVCETVNEARQRQEALPPVEGKAPVKILLVFQPQPPFFLSLAVLGNQSLCEPTPPDRDRHPPPVPPPRGLIG